MLQRVVLHLHEPELPRAEHLVAHAPELHAVRLFVAVLDAPAAADGVSAAVGVLDPLRRRVGVAEAGVGRDHWLGVDQTAKGDELIRAEVVVLDPGPRRVLARRTPVAVPDAVAPVVAADEITARPAIDRALELLQQRERVSAQAVDVVGGHQRRRPEEHVTLEHADLQQRALLDSRLGGESEGPLREVITLEGNFLHGAIGRALSPDQCYLDLSGAAQRLRPDVAVVTQAGLHAEVALADARAGIDARRVVPDERTGLDHRHRRRVADDLPRRGAHDRIVAVESHLPREIAALDALVRRVLRRDREIEFPVLQHLGPDAAVDATAEVLDELAVDVRIDRFTGLGGVDLNVDGAGAQAGQGQEQGGDEQGELLHGEGKAGARSTEQGAWSTEPEGPATPCSLLHAHTARLNAPNSPEGRSCSRSAVNPRHRHPACPP